MSRKNAPASVGYSPHRESGVIFSFTRFPERAELARPTMHCPVRS